MIKLMISFLAIFGMACLASAFWPKLYSEAVNLGGVSLSGVILLGGLIVLLTFRK